MKRSVLMLAAAVPLAAQTMAKQALITDETFKDYLSGFAKAHKVDAAKAVAALDDLVLIAEVDKGYREGIARGVAHTPTVLVNGEPFIEEFPVADIMKAIDRELAATKR